MDYRATLNLPQTKFKMKANLTQNEPAAQALGKGGTLPQMQDSFGATSVRPA